MAALLSLPREGAQFECLGQAGAVSRGTRAGGFQTPRLKKGCKRDFGAREL